MTQIEEIKKALVVLSPDLIRPDQPMASALLRRAVELARITGCELELFHVCYDGRLEDGLFKANDELESERRRLTDEDTTRLAELATWLRQESVQVTYDVRWDAPRSDAILRKIARSRPDVVLKQARERSYFLGIVSNTDWELARRSTTNLWLVNDNVVEIDNIIAAIGSNVRDPAEITTAADYQLLQTAATISKTFQADVYPVNTYQGPTMPEVMTGPAGATVGMTTASDKELRAVRQDTERKCSGMVKALAKYFGIPRDNVRVLEGRPDIVIPDVAEKVAADLIVLGARSLGRFERMITSVTVEPVLARTDCDVLVVRSSDLAGIPEPVSSQHRGEPTIDLEHAILHPQETFETPQQVVTLAELSIALRERLLQAWEYDIRAQMAVENEGGPVGDIDANVLDDLLDAKALLDMKRDGTGDEHPTLDRAAS